MARGINQSLAWVIAFITAAAIFMFGAFLIYRTNIKTIADRSRQVDHLNNILEDHDKTHEKFSKTAHEDVEAVMHGTSQSQVLPGKEKEVVSPKGREKSEKADALELENPDVSGKVSREHGENREGDHAKMTGEDHQKKSPK